eukprot:TRINITY_DN2193_c0_g1_i1.p1 TRINITY_DN2193_c0_g1~~TRINITY_DN2193_c0_g1_i1.p1  ORF type:complete len:229 (-),score=27.58 TRINITY_DN2193_c0_g1_i1:59-745(-)
MKVIYFLLFSICFGKIIVTKEYIGELKKIASWEVTEYEDNIFKGMDESDLQDSTRKGLRHISKLNSYAGADCIHEPRSQESCAGSSFAIAVAGMISDRCCMSTHNDYGWLSPMELLSCDMENYGCAGGWPLYSVQYAKRGLVREDCYPYTGDNENCPEKCEDSEEFLNKSRVCNCTNIQTLKNLEEVKKALKSGPVVVTFDAYDDLFSYKDGVYCHKIGRYILSLIHI